jgi:uncharacterized membrane protein
MMMHGTEMMSMMGFILIVGLLLIAVFVLIGVVIAKWLGGSAMPFSASKRENSLEILRKRYATGEISRTSSKL